MFRKNSSGRIWRLGAIPSKTGGNNTVVYYIRESFDGEEKAFYIFIITALGLGIATRNTLQTLAIS